MTSDSESSVELGINPFGELEPPGAEWSEAREFARRYAGNPHAQARLLKTLIGLYKLSSDNIVLNAERGVSNDEQEAGSAVIRGTIRYVTQQFSDWQQDCLPHADFGLDPYRSDPLLTAQINEILG